MKQPRNALRSATLLLILGLLFSLTVAGQESKRPYSSAAQPRHIPERSAGTAALLGKSMNAEGRLLAGVRVVLTAEADEPLETLSGKDGIFRVPELPPGEYQIVFQLSGFQTLTRRNVRSIRLLVESCLRDQRESCLIGCPNLFSSASLHKHAGKPCSSTVSLDGNKKTTIPNAPLAVAGVMFLNPLTDKSGGYIAPSPIRTHPGKSKSNGASSNDRPFAQRYLRTHVDQPFQSVA